MTHVIFKLWYASKIEIKSFLQPCLVGIFLIINYLLI